MLNENTTTYASLSGRENGPDADSHLCPLCKVLAPAAVDKFCLFNELSFEFQVCKHRLCGQSIFQDTKDACISKCKASLELGLARHGPMQWINNVCKMPYKPAEESDKTHKTFYHGLSRRCWSVPNHLIHTWVDPPPVSVSNVLQKSHLHLPECTFAHNRP